MARGIFPKQTSLTSAVPSEAARRHPLGSTATALPDASMERAIVRVKSVGQWTLSLGVESIRRRRTPE